MSSHEQETQSTPVDPANALKKSRTADDEDEDTGLSRSRSTSNASTVSRLVRTASIKLLDSHPPAGAWAATANVTAKAPTVSDIKKGSYCDNGWKEVPQQIENIRRTNTASSNAQGSAGLSTKEQSRSNVSKAQAMNSVRAGTAPMNIAPPLEEEHIPGPQTQENSQDLPATIPQHDGNNEIKGAGEPILSELTNEPALTKHLTYGYTAPPHMPWKKATAIALKAFWRFFCTPKGFLITLYCLNVVAWGGMLFLLLVNAAPAMCRPTCDDINSPRRIWLEIDSQILNALFCVTGLGLIPWRFKELYFLMQYRIQGRMDGLRKLAGIHRNWFRLKDSDLLDTTGPNGVLPLIDKHNPAVPLPISKTPEPPITGVRAPPTKVWKLDFVIWMNVWNTFFQICLCGFMWGFNRHDRPSWSTGLFIALACIVAAAGGIMMFKEGKKVKRVEGVAPPSLTTTSPRDDEKGSQSSGNQPPN